MGIEKRLHVSDCMLRLVCYENEESVPVLLVLHGGPGSGADALLGIPAFKRLNELYTTVYFDQRGCGQSYYNLSKGLEKEALIQDVHEVVEFIKTEYPNRPVYLLGCSFGGLLALLYLERYQKEVNRAVISSPSVLTAAMEWQVTQVINWMKENADKYPAEYQKIIEGISAESAYQDNAQVDCVLDELKELPKGLEIVLYSYAMRKWFPQCDARLVLTKLCIKTLLQQGEKDPVCPCQLLQDAHKVCGNPLVDICLYPECGHNLFEDAPELFVNQIQMFLEEKPIRG